MFGNNKEKIEDWLDKKEVEGEAYQMLIDDFEKQKAPTTKRWGENLVFITAILYFPFYIFQWDFSLWIFQINTVLLNLMLVSGLVLKFRAEQLLAEKSEIQQLKEQTNENVSNIAEDTAKSLLEDDDELEDIDREVEKMLEQEEKEEDKK